MCKRQTSVSHSSTGAEIIYLDADLRMDGIPALTLWHLVIEIFQSVPNQTNNSSVKRPAKVALRKQRVLYSLPERPKLRDLSEDQNYKGPCRRRNGEAVPRAVNFGDLITADHKVLSDNCESRNYHRYAVVVQDLATQWIQAYPCKNKTSQETQRSLQKFLEPERKPKVIYTDNSLEFGKACEDLSWNHCTSTPHRSETNGIAERAVRRVKEGTSAVLLQLGLDKDWWADSMECILTCETFKNSCLMEKLHTRDVLGNHLKGPIIPFGSLVEYHPITAKDQSRIHQFGKKVLPGLFLGYALYAGGILER